MLDVLCISEISQKENTMFKRNINLDNFHPIFSTGSKTARGGTAIYVRNTHNTMERMDLKSCNLEYESTWVEIKNQKSKNILIGCIYRHPHYNNLDEFNLHMKNTLLKIGKENKEDYICGDFNINLLKYENDSAVQDLMTSNGFLPHITLSTRLTNTTMSIINNIYSNTLTYNSFSGNIIIEIADHLAQFLSMDKSKVEYKKINMYKRDYKNFDSQSFIEDITIQKWNNDYNNTNDCYNDFIFRLEGCVNRHAPQRKLNLKEKKMSQKPWITNDLLKN